MAEVIATLARGRVGIDRQVEPRRPALDPAQHQMLDRAKADRATRDGLSDTGQHDRRGMLLPRRISRACRVRREPTRPHTSRGNLSETSLPGVFAIGDVRSGSTKRVAAAVGDGAQVVAALHAFLVEAGDKDVLTINGGRQ